MMGAQLKRVGAAKTITDLLSSAACSFLLMSSTVPALLEESWMSGGPATGPARMTVTDSPCFFLISDIILNAETHIQTPYN
jgi:hypothetical protein